MVLIVAFVGPVISTFFDQAIRNIVDEWMSEADLFDSISLSPDDYAELPLYYPGPRTSKPALPAENGRFSWFRKYPRP